MICICYAGCAHVLTEATRTAATACLARATLPPSTQGTQVPCPSLSILDSCVWCPNSHYCTTPPCSPCSLPCPAKAITNPPMPPANHAARPAAPAASAAGPQLRPPPGQPGLLHPHSGAGGEGHGASAGTRRAHAPAGGPRREPGYPYRCARLDRLHLVVSCR